MAISLRVVPQLHGHLSLKFTHINRNFRSCSTFPHWACVCMVLWWVYAWLLDLNAVTVLWMPSAYYQEMSIKWTASKQPTANRTSLACKHFLAIKCLRMQDPWGFSEGVSSSESDLRKTLSKSSHPPRNSHTTISGLQCPTWDWEGEMWTLEAGERIQWLKIVATKPDHWSSISCTHVVGGESWLLQAILCLHTCAVAYVCTQCINT